MRGILLFFVLLIVVVQVAGAQSIITVEVREDGNAQWTIEKRLPLINQSDIDDWEDFIKTGTDGNQKDLEDFSKKMEVFLVSAREYSKRPMKAENFHISYDTAKTPSSSFGIIRFSFDWMNFSRNEGGTISIGDAFSEGMVLSQDNVLVIRIPDGFDVKSASPNFDKRDGNRLIWDGTLYRNFEKGEPAVVLTKSGFGLWPIIFVLIVIAIAAYVMMFKRKPDSKPDTENKTMTYEDMITDDLKYEQMIESFLNKSGGQAPQSDIIDEIGFSKSRVSTILSKMKEKGQIIKIKNGNRNLIRLTNNR